MFDTRNALHQITQVLKLIKLKVNIFLFVCKKKFLIFYNINEDAILNILSPQ